MSRSGYSDDCDGWALIRWRGAVESAIRGKRGQTLLREMLTALDAMPRKRLIADELITRDGECCALGAVAMTRGLSVNGVDVHDRESVADLFGIAPALAAEVVYENDEGRPWVFDGKGYRSETPEERFKRMRAWVAAQIKEAP